MKQLIQNLKTGETVLEDVPVPLPGQGQVLIRTCCSLVSLGTERMLVEFGKANLLQKARQQPDKVKQVLDKIRTDGLMPTLEAVFKKLDEPLPLGYCNVGVIQMTDDRRQRSESGGQTTESRGRISSFPMGDRVVSNGPHAEYVRVPENLCANIGQWPVRYVMNNAILTVRR